MISNTLGFNDALAALIERTESAIDQHLPSADTRPTRIHQAMRYSMQIGGKRLRPALLIAAAEGLGRNDADPMPAAVAIECLHTYSLIHDDLPTIDNSDLRRGKPTSHIQFDEPTALLAGDALLNFSYELLSQSYGTPAELGLALIRDLAIAGGSQKLIGGQMEDVLGEKQCLILSPDDLDFIHRNKTAAMIQAALIIGCRLGGADDSELQQAEKLGLALGMAFQVIDDILDATQSTENLGKPAGLDAEREKTTYISMHGLNAARDAAERFSDKARRISNDLFGEASFVLLLVEHMRKRLS
ncbi:MAG: polyprenyl synthetase family protein [Opitutales bacterium]|nr:polyprenyl synthetase family protein [Opitutales bacterium]NRA26007.1 polyprenyl synthetase family protein [Opitutales bacterium]